MLQVTRCDHNPPHNRRLASKMSGTLTDIRWHEGPRHAERSSPYGRMLSSPKITFKGRKGAHASTNPMYQARQLLRSLRSTAGHLVRDHTPSIRRTRTRFRASWLSEIPTMFRSFIFATPGGVHAILCVRVLVTKDPEPRSSKRRPQAGAVNIIAEIKSNLCSSISSD